MKKNQLYFKWKSSIIVLTLLVASLFIRTPMYGQFVHTEGTQIVDENGNDLYFSGMNLGNWLLWEGYLMMGDFNFRTHTQFLNSVSKAFGNDMAKAKEFEHQWRMNYVTEKGIMDLKNLGYNSVRLPFHYNLFWDGSKVIDDGFQYFDRLIEFCRKYDMHILLDMHAAPGYQNPGDHSDNVNSNANQPRETVTFWDGNNINIASAVWKHIATKYKNEPVIWGYDLINEPVLAVGREYELLGSMKKMRDAIRQVDNNHIIVAEGNWWGSEMDKLDWTDPLVQAESGITARWDDNLVYQTHHYSTNVALLDDRLAICNKLGVPMILGEYGESDNGNLSNMTNWCINNNVDFFPWSFKKMSHDKCLWTIPPNAAYEQLKAFINNGTPAPGNLYDNMIKFCKNNITNGSPGIVFDQGWYNATKPPCDLGAPANVLGIANSTTTIALSWDDTANGEKNYVISRNGNTIATLPANSSSYSDKGLTGDTCYEYSISAIGTCSRSTVAKVCTPCGSLQEPYSGSPARIPGLIEAENYDLGCGELSYSDTTDGNIGGEYRTDDVDIAATVDNDLPGFNVGWVADGEWLAYTVNVQKAGAYKLSYRVATPEIGAKIELKIGDNILSTTNIPATGDWNIWATVKSKSVNLKSGKQVIQIYFRGAEVNLNSFSFATDSGIPNKVPVANAGSNQALSSEITSTILDGSGSNDADKSPEPLKYSWSQTFGPEVTISDTSVVSPTVSGLSNGNSYEFQLVVNDGEASSNSSNVTITVEKGSTPAFKLHIEAEDYSDQSGTQTENCSEGGQNVGWTDGGDWLNFHNLTIPATGIYTVSYRVASENNQGSFNFESDNGATNHGSVNINTSGSNGWQDWKTISHVVTLQKGTRNYGIGITGSGFNINWFEITSGANTNLAKVDEASLVTITLSPNPVKTNLIINGITKDFTVVTIYSLDGRKQLTRQLNNIDRINVDVSSLGNGIFFAQLSGNTTSKILKFAK